MKRNNPSLRLQPITPAPDNVPVSSRFKRISPKPPSMKSSSHPVHFLSSTSTVTEKEIQEYEVVRSKSTKRRRGKHKKENKSPPRMSIQKMKALYKKSKRKSPTADDVREMHRYNERKRHQSVNLAIKDLLQLVPTVKTYESEVKHHVVHSTGQYLQFLCTKINKVCKDMNVSVQSREPVLSFDQTLKYDIGNEKMSFPAKDPVRLSNLDAVIKIMTTSERRYAVSEISQKSLVKFSSKRRQVQSNLDSLLEHKRENIANFDSVDDEEDLADVEDFNEKSIKTVGVKRSMQEQSTSDQSSKTSSPAFFSPPLQIGILSYSADSEGGTSSSGTSSSGTSSSGTSSSGTSSGGTSSGGTSSGGTSSGGTSSGGTSSGGTSSGGTLSGSTSSSSQDTSTGSGEVAWSIVKEDPATVSGTDTSDYIEVEEKASLDHSYPAVLTAAEVMDEEDRILQAIKSVLLQNQSQPSLHNEAIPTHTVLHIPVYIPASNMDLSNHIAVCAPEQEPLDLSCKEKAVHDTESIKTHTDQLAPCKSTVEISIPLSEADGNVAKDDSCERILQTVLDKKLGNDVTNKRSWVNGYQLFSKVNNPRFRQAWPKLQGRDTTQLIGQAWKDLPADLKQVYSQCACSWNEKKRQEREQEK